MCKGIDIEGLLWEQRTANPSAGTDLTTGEYGTIYLYRPGKSTGWRVRLPLAVDGRAIDQVRNRTYYLLHVSPGEHVLSVNMERDHYEISVDVEAGKTSWVRLGPKRTKWQFALMEENSEVKKRNQCEIAKELNLTSGN